MLRASRRTLLAACALIAVSASGVGCSDDPIEPDDDGCPAGTVANRAGRCVRVIGDEDDTGDGAGGRDVEGADTERPAECVPGSRICDDGVTVAECNAEGTAYVRIPCEESEICVESECIASTTGGCEPGIVLGCDSPTVQRVCADNGVDHESRPCPPETPNCLPTGECAAGTCEPGTRRCAGNNVVECGDNGEFEAEVALCQYGCSAGQCIDPCVSDGKDYLGCTFWAADFDNLANPFFETLGSADDAQFGITVSNAGRYEVTVTITATPTGEETERTIAPGHLETILLDPQNIEESELSNRTFRVTSDAPITVHQFNPVNNVEVRSNDASLLLPSTSLGTEYIVVGWPTFGVEGGALESFVSVIAVSPGTTDVTVTTSVDTAAGDGVTALRAGAAQTFTMEEGQVLTLATEAVNEADLTGTMITATANIAVFSGSECANIPLDNNFCDHLEQQLFPVDTWGDEFVGAKFQPRGSEPDIWRVVAAESGTTITTSPPIPGINERILGRGEHIEFTTDLDFVLTSNGPVSLAQFMVGSAYPGPANGCDVTSPLGDTSRCAIPRTCPTTNSAIGDPAFLINVPLAQFRNDYIVLTPAQYQEDYLTIIAPPDASVTIDGAEVAVSGASVGAWEILRVPTVGGAHVVAADRPIGLYAYGYGCDVSYAYPGGLNLDSL